MTKFELKFKFAWMLKFEIFDVLFSRPREISCRRGVHQADVGSGHLLRQREDGLLSRGHDRKPVPPDLAHRRNIEKYKVRPCFHMGSWPIY